LPPYSLWSLLRYADRGCEIFGPVLCLIPYKDEEDAIRIANDCVYGLGGYVQSKTQSHARAVARRLRTGTVALNNPPVDPHAPFGGYKMSGNGRERGRYGLEDCLLCTASD
jgi:aldehyde dehydrogenase (NAD+)